MKFRNFKMVDYVIYGSGCFDQLGEILAPKRIGDAPMIFLVDEYFQDKKEFLSRIPLQGKDKIVVIDVTHEPKTTYVDKLRDELTAEFGKVSGIIGIGGGSVMDMAKAVSLMMTNPGSSADYQGWDLVKVPGVYKVGIPTISGTGAEVSRTCVLTGPTRKLGMNSDFTPFDQIVLDPALTRTVEPNQRFYTAMDCFIHCVESLQGTYLNAFSKSYGEKAQELCEEIFLEKETWDDDADEKLMMASYAGGMSIAYSQVGVAHAVSYGLAYLLGTKHGIGNCIVFDKLEEFYPDGVKKFKEMVKKHNIDIPQGITKGLTDEQFETMINVSLGMAPLWENALGKDWKEIMTRERLRKLYERL
ncbi:Alcohol dehydrogenase, class IV [Chitinophaga terrae (ex Kim and Jung 2007)]|jgi:3-deoxy-alpha-D-manno-octulosonate 8-oxidase|uniref:Alcohol dehydrogenase, class IV n=1 Tax=Chitinophaga terrae (ex Kim and Jung 2007) TaxID=408074 RepID=A0A1H4EDP8_9BACT|nr:iron-containing alcohol dehydrogenase family protein [Chitinophaga terrae (ex Kim and Jung 2007)]MDQ0105497.1 3-deoxy-alpha-D-manno-octulosonate 8-oxidase [Chitinophaga terrae (ex Kim and Jung 2007)]GEP91539.1 3-deoxy-alpha-D-manno-octulosonate 8-oxidase [Chitinophaga terrae (ex Kim and Jung 2007)]SEA82402.1 Alcohol dehydrogenase, class IV [Chitinophaga terrae (ex Kim and Jung 2007)]